MASRAIGAYRAYIRPRAVCWVTVRFGGIHRLVRQHSEQTRMAQGLRERYGVLRCRYREAVLCQNLRAVEMWASTPQGTLPASRTKGTADPACP